MIAGRLRLAVERLRARDLDVEHARIVRADERRRRVEQADRTIVRADADRYAGERDQQIDARRGRQIAVVDQASRGLLDEIVGARPLVLRQVGAGGLEDRDHEIAHDVRADRLLPRDARLPQREAERGDDREQERGRRQHAALVARDELARAIPARRRVRGDRKARQMAFDVVGERAGRCVAPVGLGLERLQQDVVEIAAQAPLQRRIAVGIGERRRPARRPAGARAEQELMQQHAERVDVGRGRHDLAGDLLRRRVVGREYANGRALDVVLEQLRDAEVEELHGAVGRDEDVRRLDVAVHDQRAMRGFNRAANGQEEREPRAQVERARVRVARDRLAVHVFHDEVRHAGVGEAAVDQPRDIRMVEAREHAALALEEALLDLRVEPAPEQLDRDVLAEVAALARTEKHGRHAALAEQAHEPEHADALPD